MSSLVDEGEGEKLAGTDPFAGELQVDAPKEPDIKDNNPEPWFYEDGVPGSGEKPDWWKSDKYKTVVDQAKAYRDLEKKFGAFTGSPEQYDLAIESAPDFKFSEEDDMIKDFVELAKENNVNQGFFSKMLEMHARALTSQTVDREAELAKLGPNGRQDINILTTFAKNNLTVEEFDAFKGLLTTAESVRLLDKFRQLATQPEVAVEKGDYSSESKEAILAEVGTEKYNNDENYRNLIRSKLSKVMSQKAR